jgi:outer membrane protein TolC
LVFIHAGCTPVDRWPAFDQALRQPLLPRGTAPVFVPIDIQTPEKEALLPDLLPGGSSELSVEQAVMLGLRYNRDLNVSQLAPLIAGTFEQIERGTFDPELFAEAAYFKEKSTDTRDSAGDERDDLTRDRSIVAGLRQGLPTGTAFEASVGQVGSTRDEDDEEQQSRLALSVTQSLLQGFGADVNLARVRQAELNTLASTHELQGFTESLLAGIEIAYWQYVLANEEIAIFEQSLAVAKKQREEVALRIEVGLLPEFEVAAFRAEEALRVQALINARSRLEESRLRLLRFISANPDGFFVGSIRTTSEPRLVPQEITDLTDRLQLAEQSRADLLEARLRLQQHRLETIVTKNGLLPRLELFISLGKTGYGESFNASLREIDGDNYDLSGGLRFSQMLGNRAAEARNLASYTREKQAVEAVANLRQIVHLDVRLAVNEVERLRRQIDASRATRVYQEQTTNAEKERFDVGAGTALQVAQAQRDLLFTQIAEVEAIVNYRIALVQLYQAEGSLLERRGVQLHW